MPKCPFIDPEFAMEIDDPCPVCGMTGHIWIENDKCVGNVVDTGDEGIGPLPQVTMTRSSPGIVELKRKAELFQTGAKQIYDDQGIDADMWFLELFHFLDDVQEALRAPAQAATIELLNLADRLEKLEYAPDGAVLYGNDPEDIVYSGERNDIVAALRGVAQASPDLTTLIREYARDLRRNSSGGDDYPWEVINGVADYLEILIERAAQPNGGKP